MKLFARVYTVEPVYNIESNVHHLPRCYSYHEALVIITFKELAAHHDEICELLFHTIVNDKNYRLYKLLPAPHESTYSLTCAAF